MPSRIEIEFKDPKHGNLTNDNQGSRESSNFFRIFDVNTKFADFKKTK